MEENSRLSCWGVKLGVERYANYRVWNAKLSSINLLHLPYTMTSASSAATGVLVR